MGSKTLEALDEETRHLRLEMSRLMNEENLTVDQALLRVLSNDNNRQRKLRTWKNNGLWPLSGDTPPVIAKAPTIAPQTNYREEDIMSALTPDMVAQLVEAANKLAAIEEIKLREPSYRPRFKGKRRPTSVRLPKLLEDAALNKAIETGDANRTGNTLAGLIDLLLWRYVECDVSLLGDSKDTED